NGTITIASFSNDKSLHPCTLNSVPINTTILLVPFNEGLNYGCSSYSDKTIQTINDSATVTSQLLSTTYHSTSEYYSMVTHGHSTTDFPTDNRPTPTMARNPSTITTMDRSFETSLPDHRNLKLNQRAIMNHINSRDTTNDTTNDSSTRIEVLIFTSMNNGDPGIKEKYIGSLQTLSKTAPVLTLMKIEDMSNVQDILNQPSYAVVTQDSGPWINLLNSQEFLIWTIIVGILYGIIIIIALGLLLWGIYKNKYDRDNPKPWLLAGIVLCATSFIIVFVVLETIFILSTICGYAIFGVIIILARKNDLAPIVDPTAQRNIGQARRDRTNKEILKTGILTISLILSFLFITVHTLVAVFLNATIRNFWIVRITDDLSFVIGCIILLIALHSDSISKYSHMTYISSPEDTSTENSRNTSRSSSNGGETSTRNDRRKRNTIEILFGRKSFVGL
ncbi:14639_t:CDS:2, partial [Racocetra persica]